MKRFLAKLALIYGLGYVLAAVGGLAVGTYFYVEHGDQALPEMLKIYERIL